MHRKQPSCRLSPRSFASLALVRGLLRWGVLVLTVGCASGPSPRARVETQDPVVDARPRPPADLDARLVAYYPLRGLVLRENGVARVRFTVDVVGVVTTGEVLFASGPAYASACRRMLAATTWTPAESDGIAVPFTSTFDCRFEHGAAFDARSVAPPVVASLPDPPDYGSDWLDRDARAEIGQDAEAQLNIVVGIDGRVQVTSVVDGSNPKLAAACTRSLEHGPAWKPARNAADEPVPYREPFLCVLDMERSYQAARLSTRKIGASGALRPDQVASVVADQIADIVACLKHETQAVKAFGRHWLAFEIRAGGDVARVEWVERSRDDEPSSTCVLQAVQRWPFPPASNRTIADVELYVGTNPD